MRNDLHVTGIRLKKLSYLKKKLSRSVYLHVSAVFITKEKSLLFDGVKHRNEKEHSSS